MMIEKQALSSANLDLERELCKQGCRNWVRWYKGVKGRTKGKWVHGCQIGLIPEKRNGQSYCYQHKPKKLKEAS